MKIYTYEKIVYHFNDTCPGSYNKFRVKYNILNASHNNKILNT